jgi:hypothetical protein
MVEYHWPEGHYDRLPALMADLVRRQVAEIATPASNVTSLVVVRSQPHWFFSRPNLRLYQTLKRAKAVPPGGRSQWHHPHPEHCLVADIDIVLARECQLAVIANTEHR